MFVTAFVSCKSSNNYSPSSSYYYKEPDLTNIIYQGGDGKTMEDAIIIINARNSRDGIAAEYEYIKETYGTRNIEWKLISQSLDRSTNKKYDIIKIQTIPENKDVTLYFDITNFFGKL